MSSFLDPVRLALSGGRLVAERIETLNEVISSDTRLNATCLVLDVVLKRWAEQRPGGYAVPCWEEAVRDTFHTAFSMIPRQTDGVIQLGAAGRLFVRSSMGQERTCFRTRRAGPSPDDLLMSGDRYSFYRDLNKQEWARFLELIGTPFEVLRSIPTKQAPSTPWIQTDAGAVDQTSDSPFRFLARVRYDVFARQTVKRAIMKDRELVLLDESFSSRHALLSLHDAFREVTLPVLRFESLLRVMDVLGVTDEMILAYTASDPPLSLELDGWRSTPLRVNHPLHGRLSWNGREVSCGFFLGGSREELLERHTFHTLWDKYGLPDMPLKAYLNLRRPAG